MWLRETFSWNISNVYEFPPEYQEANTCSNGKQLLLLTVVFYGDLLYKVAIDLDLFPDILLVEDNEFQMGHESYTM